MTDIPRLVMQTWKNEVVPEHWQDSQEAIFEHLDDWSYTLMTDDMNRDFVEEHFPDFLDSYDAFPHNIQRADAIRACWLYVHGGLYIDLDLMLMKPLDDILGYDNDLYLINSGNLSNCYTNAFMISRPKHPFWLVYLEEMKKPPKWYTGLSHHLYIMTTTGPMAFTRSIKRALSEGMDLNIKVLNNTEMLGDCDACSEKPYYMSGSYIKTLQGSSWVKADGKIITFAFCNKMKIIILVIIVLVIIFAIKRNS